ncbi:hypothetical protein B296_00014009, partial [Ensete ventricosum]
ALALLQPHYAAVVAALAQATAALCGRPLQVAKPWLVATTGALAVANHLCMQTACMWPPLPRRQCLLSLLIDATSA